MQLESEPSIYLMKDDKFYMMIHVATDDFLLLHNDGAKAASFIERYQQHAPLRFEGGVKRYLGWNIEQSPDRSVAKVDQRDYIANMVVTYKVKPLPRTKVTPLKLSDDHMPSLDGPESIEDAIKVSPRRVFELYGQLNWLATGTRPDIREALSELGRFLKSPSHKLWLALLHLVSYLASTIDEKLVYGNVTADEDHIVMPATTHISRKASPAWAISSRSTVPLSSGTLQSVIAQSTTEAEYIVMAEVCKSITLTLSACSLES